MRNNLDLTRSGSEAPSYLSDSHGRSVTPIITPAPTKSISTTTATQGTAGEDVRSSPPPPAPVMPRLGPGRPPKDGISKAERDITAPLKKLEEHQKAVGPTMDRMGCILANEQRRAGFLDDEDFEDEVYDSP